MRKRKRIHFSVRDKSGKSRVTVEYRFTRSVMGLPEFILIQQKGFQNTRPGGECLEALNALHRFTGSSNSQRKMLAMIYQKESAGNDKDLANKYLCSLSFINFLQREIAGRFDFDELAAKMIIQNVRCSGEINLTSQNEK